LENPPKGAPDADAFIQKSDFKGHRPLMGAGQSPAGFREQRPWASLWLELSPMGLDPAPRDEGRRAPISARRRLLLRSTASLGEMKLPWKPDIES
jgi:hypothetical protein